MLRCKTHLCLAHPSLPGHALCHTGRSSNPKTYKMGVKINSPSSESSKSGLVGPLVCQLLTLRQSVVRQFSQSTNKRARENGKTKSGLSFCLSSFVFQSCLNVFLSSQFQCNIAVTITAHRAQAEASVSAHS